MSNNLNPTISKAYIILAKKMIGDIMLKPKLCNRKFSCENTR